MAINIDIESLTKYHYGINEVAEMFDVNSSLLRYWESEFSQLRPIKSRQGKRFYKKKDIILLMEIYDLVKIKGFKLQGAKSVIKEKRKLDKNNTSSAETSSSNNNESQKEIKSRLEKIKLELVTMYLEL
jgi:DNA-binding transcriptional MerR regulator